MPRILTRPRNRRRAAHEKARTMHPLRPSPPTTLDHYPLAPSRHVLRLRAPDGSTELELHVTVGDDGATAVWTEPDGGVVAIAHAQRVRAAE
jgi:hypothetical protein